MNLTTEPSFQSGPYLSKSFYVDGCFTCMNTVCMPAEARSGNQIPEAGILIKSRWMLAVEPGSSGIADRARSSYAIFPAASSFSRVLCVYFLGLGPGLGALSIQGRGAGAHCSPLLYTIIYLAFIAACVRLLHACLALTEPGRGCQVPRNWSYGLLGATVWVLWDEPGSSTRVDSALNL